MPRLTPTQRLRAKLRVWLKPHGKAAELSRYSKSGGRQGLSPQEITYFLRETPKRRGIVLDDLDDLAGFFHISIGELLGETKLGDLTGDEQRIIYAFRVLPEPVQTHFLSLIEQMSLAPRTKYLPATSKLRIKETQ